MNSGPSLLSRLPLFSDVAPGALARLEHRMRPRAFAPRTVIVRRGTADDSAFIILSGRVAVRRRDADSGIDFVLAELDDERCRRDGAAHAEAARGVGGWRMAALVEHLDKANRHNGIDFVNSTGQDRLARPGVCRRAGAQSQEIRAAAVGEGMVERRER